MALDKREINKREINKMKKNAVSGIMLILLLTNILTLALNVQPVNGSGTIYISPDGSVEPATAPIERIGNLYTLTENISGSIIVEKDSIAIDGNGYALQGTVENIIGIDLTERSRVAVKNLYISFFQYGIFLYYSSDITLTNNTFADCRYGIKLWHSDNNILMSNTAINNCDFGISLMFSSYNTLSDNEIIDNFIAMEMQWGTENTLRNNIMVGNKYSTDIGHFSLPYYLHDIDSSNTINGESLYYGINRRDETIPSDAGCIYIINSTGIKVEHLTLTDNVYPLTIGFSTKCSVTDVTATHNMYGVNIEASSQNVIAESNCSNNAEGGFQLTDSSYNLLINNVAMNNNGLAMAGASAGIYLEDTHDETLVNNLLVNNTQGIGLDDSSNIEVIGNDIIGNFEGMMIGGGIQSSIIAENNFVSNDIGIWIAQLVSRPNEIYHNNFINNSKQIGVQMMVGSYQWDDDYPSGGNYWSDYLGWDADDDGIGDQPYVINQDNQDRYPLMSPYGSPPLPMHTLIIEATDGGTTNPAPENYTHSERQNIPVNAIPSSGYLFDHWELDGISIGASNPVNVTMNADHTLRAVFKLAYTLTVTAGTGGKTNPTSGTYTHAAETIVTVTATPKISYYFDRWELDGANYSNNPIAVTMNMTHTLKAFFAQLEYTLAITRTEGGTTDPTPGAHTYYWGTTVSVAALPNAGYYLDHWELDDFNIGIHNLVNVTMKANHTLHAVYKQLNPGHDIAIKDVTSKTVVGQGYPLTIKVTAMNIGSFTETFDVTVYANVDPVASRPVTVESGAAMTMTFTWNTSSFAKGNYTIRAEADTVPEETNTTDNTLTDGWTIVAMIGDITGPEGWPDGKCDIRDVSLIALKFGVTYPESRYDPNCDLVGPTTGVPDGKIDIRDVATAALHYGEVDP